MTLIHIRIQTGGTHFPVHAHNDVIDVRVKDTGPLEKLLEGAASTASFLLSELRGGGGDGGDDGDTPEPEPTPEIPDHVPEDMLTS